MIIGFAAGGNIDASGRLLAQKLAPRLGQPVVVENKVGASGQVAVQYLMVQPPDGYNVMLMSAGTTIASGRSNPPFDVRRDVTPVGTTAVGPLVMYVNPDLPVKSMAELLKYAKANPGKLNYTSPGVGSLQNMLVELLKQRASIDMVHVPFKSAGESTTAVVAGRAQVGMDSLPTLKPQIDAGRLRPLVVTTAKGQGGVPGMAEAGIADYDFVSWTGIGAPPRTPRNIIDVLNRGFNDTYKDAEIQAFYEKNGQDVLAGTPEQFGQLLNKEVEVWSRLIKSANIQFE